MDPASQTRQNSPLSQSERDRRAHVQPPPHLYRGSFHEPQRPELHPRKQPRSALVDPRIRITRRCRISRKAPRPHLVALAFEKSRSRPFAFEQPRKHRSLFLFPKPQCRAVPLTTQTLHLPSRHLPQPKRTRYHAVQKVPF